MTFNRTAIAVALFAVSTGVYASGGEGNNTGCNGKGNANSPCVPAATSNATSNPVQGQAQGQAQGQLQGQAQGQQQGQSQVGINANAQTNTQSNSQFLSIGYSMQDFSVQNSWSQSAAQGGAGGTATANGGSANSTNTTSSNAQGGTVAASGNATNSGNNTGTSTVVVEGDKAQGRNPVASASAPTVITGSDQCLVPVALGGQAVGFGISFGVAVRDENCEVLKLSRQIEYLVDKAAAIHFLRMHDTRVDAALKSIGR